MRSATLEQAQITTLDTLRALLDAGLALATPLARAADPLLARWQRVFERVLPDDREPLLAVLESEVELRRMAHEGESVTGLDIGRPDPNARLFVRVWERRPAIGTHHDLVQAVLRGVRVMLHTPAAIGADWGAITTDVVRRLDARERAGLVSQMRGWLAAAEQVEREPAVEAS